MHSKYGLIISFNKTYGIADKAKNREPKDKEIHGDFSIEEQ